MNKIISILIVLIVLSSGCVSKNNKSGDGNDSNKDEYSTDDGAVEEDDSGIIQSERSLDLNNKNLKISDGTNVTLENIANKTII